MPNTRVDIPDPLSFSESFDDLDNPPSRCGEIRESLLAPSHDIKEG
jgi:hypothetical protein